MAAFVKVPFKDRADWLDLRKTIGIGASEVASIMGMSTYSSAAETFYRKLGLLPDRKDNYHMFCGRYYEPHIADLWQYWDGSDDTVLANYEAKRIVRKARRYNGIMQSSRYPWLFVTPDFVFKHGKKQALLEVKSIQGWEANKWETGVPIGYVYQVMSGLIVTGFDYAELVLQYDGRSLEVHPLVPSMPIFEAIIEQTKQAWDLLTEARAILAKGGKEQDIEHLIPAPDGTEAYDNFLKERYRGGQSNDHYIEAGADDRELFAHWLLADARAGEAERLAKEYEQRLKIRIDQFDGLRLTDKIALNYRYDKNGNRRFTKKGINFQDIRDALAAVGAGHILEVGTPPTEGERDTGGDSILVGLEEF